MRRLRSLTVDQTGSFWFVWVALAFALSLLVVDLATAEAGEPPEPPVEHVTVRAGEGLWSVARRLCPQAVNAQFQVLQQANPWVTVTGLDPGTVLHLPVGSCPPVVASTTSDAPTTTLTAPTSTSTTVPASTSPASSTTTTTVVSTTTSTLPPPGLLFPNPDNTGPRSSCTNPTVLNGTQTTTFHGQVIECAVINGNLRIQHNGVLVRDVRIVGVATYMIHVRRLGNSATQPCPTGVRVEYTEVDGSQTQADFIPVYALCGAHFRFLEVQGGGAGVRLVSNSIVEHSYVHTTRREGDQHRTALSMHGGTSNQVIHNTLICERPTGITSGSGGCSAALSVYGDFAVPDGFLAQDNLFVASGGYCMYGGSGHPDSNAFPEGINVDIIGNHFSTRFNPQCGIYGALTAYEDIGERGNECRGNVWHETGAPMTAAGCAP